jgi:hypothetical protein
MKTKIIISSLLLFCLCSYTFAADPVVLGRLERKGKTQAMYWISGLETIEYIANHSQQTGKIGSVFYKLKNNNKKVKTIDVLKPHLYTVLLGKKIGKELLPDNVPLIYVEEKGNEVLVKADLSKYAIPLPAEGIFVGLEYMGATTSKTDKTITSAESSFQVWHILTLEPGADDVTYTKMNGVKRDLPEKEPWLCLFGIEVVR